MELDSEQDALPLDEAAKEQNKTSDEKRKENRNADPDTFISPSTSAFRTPTNNGSSEKRELETPSSTFHSNFSKSLMLQLITEDNSAAGLFHYIQHE